MRRLTPWNTATPRPCLVRFYARRIRGGRDLYERMVGVRPGAAPAAAARRGFWAWLRG